MKKFALTISVCALGICAPAQAKVHTGSSPGNSAVNQYIETVPTDHGSQPTNSVHSGGGGGGGVNSGGGGGGGGGATGSAGNSSSSGGSSGAVSQSTQRALGTQGADGRAAAALAVTTAPSLPRHHRDLSTSTGAGSGSSSGAASGQQAGEGTSALGSLAAALTGSASGGGLGALLPVILVVALFGAAGMAVLRRRGQT